MPTGNPFKLRQVLKTLLAENKLSAAELSRKTSVSKQVLSDWLAGVRPRNIEQVKAVAEYFGISLDYLCFGETASPAKPVPATWISGRFEGRIRVIADD
jgi:transcriptional regulator with XRE-family HTH domain